MIKNSARNIGAALLGFVLMISSAVSANDDEQKKKLLQDIFSGQSIDAGWFDSSFLSQVSAQQVETIAAQYVQQGGKLVSVAGTGTQWVLRYAQFEAPSSITLDADGEIVGLWIGPPKPFKKKN